VGHVWTPIENDAFQYKEIVAPNTWALKMETFQLQRTIKDLAKSLDKVASKTNDNDHFLTMNICREQNSHQTNFVIPTFSMHSTPTNHIFIFCRGLGHVVGKCPSRCNQILIFVIEQIFSTPNMPSQLTPKFQWLRFL
jgi:hypothetical protein